MVFSDLLVIVQIVTFLGSGLAVIVTMKVTVKNVEKNLSGVQEEIKEMRRVLTEIAVADTKISALTIRVEHAEQDIRDLRRGIGLIERPS